MSNSNPFLIEAAEEVLDSNTQEVGNESNDCPVGFVWDSVMGTCVPQDDVLEGGADPKKDIIDAHEQASSQIVSETENTYIPPVVETEVEKGTTGVEESATTSNDAQEAISKDHIKIAIEKSRKEYNKVAEGYSSENMFYMSGLDFGTKKQQEKGGGWAFRRVTRKKLLLRGCLENTEVLVWS